MRQRFADALLATGNPVPPGLRTWNGSDPGRRFAVYRNNVLVSLVDALAQTFPVSLRLVGEEFFRAMAREFVRRSPPRSPLLHEYGSEFPDFVRGFPPAAGVPYLGDVAGLEWLRVQSFHAADAQPVSGAEFGALLGDPGRLSGVRLRLHPACRYASFEHAAVSIWAAHQDGEPGARFDALANEDVLVARPAHEVLVVLLGAGGAAFGQALGAGLALGEAAALASESAGFDLATNLQALITHGSVIGIDSR